MELTTEVSNLLKCGKCNELLSCGPVYLYPETEIVICGRCNNETNEEDTDTESICNITVKYKIRYVQYEAAASLLLFPCRFKKYGCTKQLQFSPGEPSPHEDSCVFKPYNCPMNPNGACNWNNTLDKFLKHCKTAHPQQVYENPCYYSPNWSVSNLRIYLITFMELLFLLHVKVCLKTGNILHSVRLLADPSKASGFDFVFKVTKKPINYSKRGNVLPVTSCLNYENSSAINSNFHNLLEIFEMNFDRSVFTVTICVVKVKCKFCQTETELSATQICAACQLNLKKCAYHSEGCTYQDVNKYKCNKHESYYCSYRTKCSFAFCFESFAAGNFFNHFKMSSCRSVISSKIGLNWNADHSSKYCVLDSVIGPILCEYSMSFSKLYIYIYTSLPSNELDFYQFVINVRNYITSYNRSARAEIVQDNYYDWKLEFKLDDFSKWRSLGVNINIKLNNIRNKF